jgi:hypothetical protein
MKVFSVNALAELFEKDRQTVVRSLRGVPADAKVRGQPRWRMATAVSAMEKHNRASDGGNSGSATNGGIDAGLADAFAEFDMKFAAMEAAPKLEDRRAMALKLGPLVNGIDRQLRAHGRAIGVGDELADYRAQGIWRLTLIGFEKPCKWSFAETHAQLGG